MSEQSAQTKKVIMQRDAPSPYSGSRNLLHNDIDATYVGKENESNGRIRYRLVTIRLGEECHNVGSEGSAGRNGSDERILCRGCLHGRNKDEAHDVEY